MAVATKAERVAWMTRTSDIVGSHLKNDLESYLTLIRRKIQERCATTQDLIIQIRRTKVGDGLYVTPNEFRFTLIKFGIILAQPLVDRIFNVFDSDRSGTMDFDEFAMWIMNSEFKPVHSATVSKGPVPDTPEEVLRKKFASCMSTNPDVFATMKKKISFLEFVSQMTTRGLSITEHEARSVFLRLDPLNTGFIDSTKLKPWCATGSTTTPAAPPRLKVTVDLTTLINRVSSRNSRAMEKSFAHIAKGSGTKIPYEEFRRCLVQNGLGKNIDDCKDCFAALGGELTGMADMDLLFATLEPMHLPTNPKSEVSVKKDSPSYVSVSRADRRLRDAMRKAYLDVKAEVIAKDRMETGYIDAEDLHAIIVKNCMAMSFQDFRFITQQLPSLDGGSKLSWSHFLNVYNPLKAPHQLNAAASLKDLSLTADDAVDNLSFSRSQQVRPLTASGLGFSSSLLASSSSFSKSGSSPQLQPLSSAGGEGDEAPQDLGTTNSVSAHNQALKKLWQTALKECHRADPDGTGLVGRMAFIGALDGANKNNVMTAERMNTLADNYSTDGGLVDYAACFREFLHEMGRASGYGTAGESAFRAPEGAKMREQKAMHPWDFKYSRDKHQMPYWYTSRQQARSTKLEEQPMRISVPPPHAKSAHDLNDHEKEALLTQYPAAVLTVCSKCYEVFKPIWRDVQNELTRAQIVSQRGSIITTKFLAILELYGVKVTKSDMGSIVRAFRGMGVQDVVKFDEFLRVCLLVKASYARR